MKINFFKPALLLGMGSVLLSCGSGLCPVGSTYHAHCSVPGGNGVLAGPSCTAFQGSSTFSGSLDTSFNTTGYTFFNIGIFIVTPTSFDTIGGKYYVSTDMAGEAFIQSVLPSGAADTTFGAFSGQWNNGNQSLSAGAWRDHLSGTAARADGTLASSGYSDWNNDGHNHCTFVNVDTTGTSVAAFGSAGIAHYTLNATNNCYSQAIVSQSDSKIVFVGGTDNPGNIRPVIGRIKTDGSLDTTFGTGGYNEISIAPAANDKRFMALKQLPSGSFVAAGYAQTATGYKFLAAKFDFWGNLDTTFGGSGTGYKTFDVSGANLENRATSLAVDCSGNIYLGGYSHNGGNYQFAMAKLKSDGTVDTSFGTAGAAQFNIGGANDNEANAIDFQADGKIILGGYVMSAGLQDFALARFLTNGSVDTSFSTGGFWTMANMVGMDNRIVAMKFLTPDNLTAAAYGDNNGNGIMKFK